MKTKIVLLIGLSILILNSLAIAEIFFQEHFSNEVHHKEPAVTSSAVSVVSLHVKNSNLYNSLYKAASIPSTYISNILNEDHFQKSKSWFIEFFSSEAETLKEEKATRAPVPPALYLLGTGLIGLAGFRGRQRNK